jgi:hypothetical protein
MKISDDYKAKIRIWAAEQRVLPPLPGPPLPTFAKQTFSSHAEMNEWKRKLLKEIAAQAAQNE